MSLLVFPVRTVRASSRLGGLITRQWGLPTDILPTSRGALSSRYHDDVAYEWGGDSSAGKASD